MAHLILFSRVAPIWSKQEESARKRKASAQKAKEEKQAQHKRDHYMVSSARGKHKQMMGNCVQSVIITIAGIKPARDPYTIFFSQALTHSAKRFRVNLKSNHPKYGVTKSMAYMMGQLEQSPARDNRALYFFCASFTVALGLVASLGF